MRRPTSSSSWRSSSRCRSTSTPTRRSTRRRAGSRSSPGACSPGSRTRATASHCVSLGQLPLDEQRAIAELVAEAGVNVIALPHTNLFLQGRGTAPMPRGLTAVAALRAAGVNVAAGADNLQDPFNPVGRACPFETAGLMIMSVHDLPAVAWSAVTDASRRTLGLPPVAITAGRPGGSHGGPRRHRARGDRQRSARPAGLEARRPDRRNRALTARPDDMSDVTVPSTGSPAGPEAPPRDPVLAFDGVSMTFPDGTHALDTTDFGVQRRRVRHRRRALRLREVDAAADRVGSHPAHDGHRDRRPFQPRVRVPGRDVAAMAHGAPQRRAVRRARRACRRPSGRGGQPRASSSSG